MPALRKMEVYASRSILLGVLGAILTGVIHWAVMTSPYDLFSQSAEFVLVLGMLVVVIGVAIWDLAQGFYVVEHLDKPHGAHAKPMAMAGITLGVLDLLPAVILLLLMLEMMAFRFIPIQPNLLDL